MDQPIRAMGQCATVANPYCSTPIVRVFSEGLFVRDKIRLVSTLILEISFLRSKPPHLYKDWIVSLSLGKIRVILGLYLYPCGAAAATGEAASLGFRAI
jgi:hypothetical protein